MPGPGPRQSPVARVAAAGRELVDAQQLLRLDPLPPGGAAGRGTGRRLGSPSVGDGRSWGTAARASAPTAPDARLLTPSLPPARAVCRHARPRTRRQRQVAPAPPRAAQPPAAGRARGERRRRARAGVGRRGAHLRGAGAGGSWGPGFGHSAMLCPGAFVAQQLHGQASGPPSHPPNLTPTPPTPPHPTQQVGACVIDWIGERLSDYHRRSKAIGGPRVLAGLVDVMSFAAQSRWRGGRVEVGRARRRPSPASRRCGGFLEPRQP
jgi:hypothetical protein